MGEVSTVLPVPEQTRSLGLFRASVLNMIDMVGIGPFVVMPVVIGLVGGMYLWAWIAGAVLALVDAMIWSELGAAYPEAGGSYNFLKAAYGPNSAGKLMSFLFVWQTIIQAPLVAASAAIGFAQYASYLFPFTLIEQKLVSGAVVLVVTALLYRKIEHIGTIGVLLWCGVAATMGCIIFGGLAHGNFSLPVHDLQTGISLNGIFSFLFGQACVKTIYSYLGYYNVCHLGGEIKSPGKNIPRSMFLSIAVIAVLYLAMNLSVLSVIPRAEIQSWQQQNTHSFLVATFIERLYGHSAAVGITIMILWVAMASLFAVLLGYSRVPFAAARDGAFFRFFGKLHPTKNFPHVSLLVIAGIGFVFSLLFRMADVISGILAMRIIVQFIGQGAGLIHLHKTKPRDSFPFRMPLYPLPVLLAIVLWAFVFFATGTTVMLSFAIVLSSGLAAYFIKARLKKEWPFQAVSR